LTLTLTLLPNFNREPLVQSYIYDKIFRKIRSGFIRDMIQIVANVAKHAMLKNPLKNS